MGIATEMNDVLRKQLSCHVAWLPISNTFALGDYGVFSQGVFTKLGTAADFGVKFDTKEGPPVKLDFSSKDTTVTSFAGAVKVDVIPEGVLDGKIKIEFQKEGSFLLKAAQVRVTEIQNVLSMMNELQQTPGWRGSYKVVAKVWRAENAALLSSLSGGTEITLAGDVPSLNKFKLGEVSADLRTGKNRELGLELMGASGVIGLGLVRRKFFGDVGFMGDAPLKSDDLEQVSPSAIPEDDV
ncbi:MAG: hypothetical protein EOO73_05535 [Myxococcales bacterium]|nr:MAG: hypothetical protein EOO73_05535 [Myxococcales bacterium]